MVGNAHSGTVALVWLPDDILLRVLRALMRDDGTQKRDNLRDLWNVATTCRKLYALALKMMQGLHTTRLELNEGVPQNVVTTMPDDVMQGAMLALRSSIKGSACKAMRVVRLNAMEREQLQSALNQLRTCSSLRVLCFVDVEGGVKLPDELARRVKVLSITSPSSHTLRALREARCAPRMLRLFCVNDDAAFELNHVWEELTREMKTMDITWSGGLVPRYEYDGVCYLPVSDAQFQGMRMNSRHRRVPWGPLYASSFRKMNLDGVLEGPIGWKTVRMGEWLNNRRSRWIQGSQLRLDMVEEEGLLTILVESPCEAKELLHEDDALMKEFVREVVAESPGEAKQLIWDEDSLVNGFGRGVVVGGYGRRRVDRLQVIVPLCCYTEQLTAKTAARLAAKAAAAADVPELVVSTLVFMQLANVALPDTVRSVGIVDDFTGSTFLRALPATLHTLANGTAAAGVRRAVWMQRMWLRDDGDALGTEALLRQAQAACRRVETEGVCAAGVRGVVEQWMQERKVAHV